MISLYNMCRPISVGVPGYQNDKTNFRRNASIFQDASHKKFEQASELGKLAYTTDPYQSV